jgi:hypothetical protein
MSAPGQETPEPPAPSAPADGAAPQETAPAAPDGFDRINERMEQFGRQQAQIAETLAGLMTPEEEEPDESEFYTDDGELTEEGARAVIADLVREGIQQELGPREAARLKSDRDDAFEALRDEYPELQDDKVANEALGAAIRWAQQNNPAIIETPGFVDVIEMAYKSARFEELRAQQPEQPRSVVLESAQGARQQQRPNEPDWGDRIVKAAQSLRPQI